MLFRMGEGVLECWIQLGEGCVAGRHVAWDLLDGVQKLPECSFTGLMCQGVNLNPRGLRIPVPPSMLQRKNILHCVFIEEDY